MSKFSHTDKSKFEHLFGMSSGYVMDFSNSSFERFIIETAQINPYELKYEIYGNSKATVVVKSDYNKGGTWNGAMENLNKRWVSLYCWNNPNYQGNKAIIERGAVPIDEDWDVTIKQVDSKKREEKFFQPSLFQLD